MSDFAQSGLICTLQRLNPANVANLETELVGLAMARPIALVLPCHGRDLGQPALTRILEELRGAKFLREIVLSVNDSVPEQRDSLAARLKVLPQKTTLLCQEPVAGQAGGKGANVRAALDHLTREGECHFIATQDCDVVSFQRIDLARLCYAACHPRLGFRFAKMYYSRATDRLFGRVSRLFVSPLLHAIVRVTGHHPLLDFLLSFRYPLAGEVVFSREVAGDMALSPGWGLEIGQLCQAFRCLDPRDICQVEGGDGYDHKHQPAAEALAGMAEEIAVEIFKQLAAEGLATDAALVDAVVEAYQREAKHALRRSASLALINGLSFDADDERAMVEAFAARVSSGIRLGPAQDGCFPTEPCPKSL